MKRKICTWAAAILIAVSAAVPARALTYKESAACRIVNEYREDHGLRPLAISEDLTSKARVKARDMKDRNYFGHQSPTYGSPFAMMQQLGVSYSSAGENLAMGFEDPGQVVRAWMASPSHRANILSPRYTTMGIGNTGNYWAQWLTRP